MTILLSGIVGSTAYGLSGPDSDVDRLGIFASPTTAFHGLHAPKETRVSSKPDVALHEAAKWCRLALGGNPTVTELVWLPDDLYEVRTSLGDELIEIRSALTSARRIRDAHFGYATQQFRRLEQRGDGSFSSDTRNRTAKHARHLARLLSSGLAFYSTGVLPVRVDDPQWFLDFGDRIAAGDIDEARRLINTYEELFDRTTSVLPEEPNLPAVEDWLQRVRRAFL